MGRGMQPPPTSKRIMSRRMQSRYPFSPCHTHKPITAHVKHSPPDFPTTTATSNKIHCHKNINPPPSAIDLCLRMAEYQTPELSSTDQDRLGGKGVEDWFPGDRVLKPHNNWLK